MMKNSKKGPNDNELNIIVVAGRVFDEEKDAEYRKTCEGVEKGHITPAALRERNCVHWDNDFELVPWHEKRTYVV